MSVLFLNILTLLAPTQSADNLFHSFTVLCENENVLVSNLHCFFANVTPCPLVLLSSLTEKKIYFCQYFHTHSIFKKNLYLISSQSPGTESPVGFASRTLNAAEGNYS